MNKTIAAAAWALAAVLRADAFAEPPTGILYQGSLTSAGAPVTGAVTLTLRLTSEDGRLQYWTSGSTRTTASGGRFTYLLGAPNEAAFRAIDWTSAKPHVEITVNGILLLPREPLRAVPYALSTRGLQPGATIQSPVLDMGLGRVTSVGAPQAPADAATKGYVDAAVAPKAVGPVTATSGTFTASGNGQFSVATASGIKVSAGGVHAPYFVGDGSRLTGLAVSTKAWANALQGLGRGAALDYNKLPVVAGGARWVDGGGSSLNGPLPNSVGHLLMFDPLHDTPQAAQYRLQLAHPIDGSLYWRSQFGGTWGGWSRLLQAAANGDVNVAGAVKAAAFVGDGSRLTGIKTTSALPSTATFAALSVSGALGVAGTLETGGGLRTTGAGDLGGVLAIVNAGKTAAGQGHTWRVYNMSGAYGNKLSFWNYDYVKPCAGGLCHERFSLYDNGNVYIPGRLGIGTTAPAAPLDVAGAIHATGSGDVGAGYLSLVNTGKTAAGQGHTWRVYNMTGGYGNKLSFWNYDNVNGCNGGVCHERLSLLDNGVVYAPGSVGIGTSSPQAKLEVRGGAIKATDGLILQVFNASDTATPRPTSVGSIWLEQ